MKIYSDFITEIGFSGRSIRNVDPIQHMIRSILSGDMDLNIKDPLKDNVKTRIIKDLSDITQGVLPMWMPQRFKLPKKQQKYLVKRLKDYIK